MFHLLIYFFNLIAISLTPLLPVPFPNLLSSVTPPYTLFRKGQTAYGYQQNQAYQVAQD